jgi:iron complex outermembrane receptor protein
MSRSGKTIRSGVRILVTAGMLGTSNVQADDLIVQIDQPGGVQAVPSSDVQTAQAVSKPEQGSQANAPAEQSDAQLEEIVVSASRSEQRRFDAPAAIDVVRVDPFRAAGPLVNLSELLPAVPGVQVRERQNYAQDLQLSVRGFGTRSTFGVRGVRILIDGIPATMPDGQGQAATASLTSARHVEVLRGPVAQLYGNASGGVVQIFTQEPPFNTASPVYGLSLGAGSYGQRHFNASVAAGEATLAGLLDVSHFSTHGYREHSAAERTQLNAKFVKKFAQDSTLTGIVNGYEQPQAQDPLGLTRAQFNQNPRQADAVALQFDTRKSVSQQQAGLVLDHKLSAANTLRARIYGGLRKVDQTLAFSGSAPTSSGGVVDLDNAYGGAGVNWTHQTALNDLPLNWTVGMEADQLLQTRRGYVNNAGNRGELRRDEEDSARNIDWFGQADWTFAPQWKAIAGLRNSTVTVTVRDRFFTSSPDDSGSVDYRNTSPVLGLVWYARENMNFYGNLGRGFETPTLAESAYRASGSGPNFSLRPSTSTQAEIGVKAKTARGETDFALFNALSHDEIVPQTNSGGRTIFQNAERVQRRGAEFSWKARTGAFNTGLAYTFLDAQFDSSYANSGGTVAAGNRLPGAPQHSAFAEIETTVGPGLKAALEMRAESKVYVNDVNSDTAPGYAVFNLRAAHEYRMAAVKLYLYGRLDNIFNRNYAGSVIVNESNGRYFEPAAGRRIFVGLRSQF